MRSSRNYAASMPKVLRPRQEFPTPLFKVTLPLLAAAAIALVVWLVLR